MAANMAMAVHPLDKVEPVNSWNEYGSSLPLEHHKYFGIRKRGSHLGIKNYQFAYIAFRNRCYHRSVDNSFVAPKGTSLSIWGLNYAYS